MSARNRDYEKETELARAVVVWLRANGWEVWQEVDGFFDILAVCAGVLWSIETKLAFSSPVLVQAWRRRGSAHRISVATLPGPSHRSTRLYHARCARELGIGVVSVDRYGVRERTVGRLHRAPGATKLLKRLEMIPRDYVEAGTNGGGYWTPFKGFVERLEAYVGAHSGCAVKAVVRDVPHHYATEASARNRVGLLAKQGVFENVRAEYVGRALCLYPVTK